MRRGGQEQRQQSAMEGNIENVTWVVPYRSNRFPAMLYALKKAEQEISRRCACVHCMHIPARMRVYSCCCAHFLLFGGCVRWLAPRQALKRMKSDKEKMRLSKTSFFARHQSGPLSLSRAREKKKNAVYADLSCVSRRVISCTRECVGVRHWILHSSSCVFAVRSEETATLNER